MSMLYSQLVTTQSTDMPDMISGSPSGMPRGTTETSSPTTTALTPGACGVDYAASRTTKGKTGTAQPTASFPDELNTFYTLFCADNTAPAMSPHVGGEAAILTLEMANADYRRHQGGGRLPIHW